MTSILRLSPNGTSTNASSVTFQVAFSEAVSGVDPSDFTLTSTGSVVTGSPQVSAVNGSIYNVTISGIVGNGTLGFYLLNNATIQSLAGSPYGPGNINSQLNFTPAVTYTVSAQPSQVVVADLNGDGFLDLATASYSSTVGTVLLGNGNGGFQPRKTFATTSSGVTSIGAGDFNGDGKIDLVVTLESTSRINLLSGDGTGGFQLLRTGATGTFPVDLAVGDFNKDGSLDVATVNRTGNSMSVLLGNGNGTFQGQKSYAAGSSPFSATSGDLNGDGNLDLVVGNSGSDTVSLYFGSSNGTFQNQQTLAVGSGPWGNSVVDLNGDGKLDIVIANHSSDNIGVLLGNGNGTFQPQQTFATLSQPYYVLAGDMNGDGKLDLVIESQGTGNLSILSGNGDGSFVQSQSYAAGRAGGISGLALADLNGDGLRDMIYMDFPAAGQGKAGVLLANSTVIESEIHHRWAAPTASLRVATDGAFDQPHFEFQFLGQRSARRGRCLRDSSLRIPTRRRQCHHRGSSLTFEGLGFGSHNLTLRRFDNAGNLGPVTIYNWTIASIPASPALFASRRTRPIRTPIR